MKHSRKSQIIIIVVSLLTLLSVALLYYYKVQTSWVESTPYLKDGIKPTNTIVVVYSRTGNTFSAAKEAARYFNAVKGGRAL